MAEKLRKSRIIFSDDDAHRLVDSVCVYKNIVECKATDATTWKEKTKIWEVITEEFNCGVTTSRSTEQLRQKYENLKRDVRKYFVKEREEIFKTGGENTKVVLKHNIKLLYEKMKSLIELSAVELDATPGDSDFTDWSHYTPKMLREKKHAALQQSQTKYCRCANIKCLQDLSEEKKTLAELKKNLLKKESDQNAELHAIKIENEKKQQLLLNLKIDKYKLQNEILKWELENRDKSSN